MSDRPTVLIIDDETQVLQVLRELLHGDYRVVIAKTGEQGLARLDPASPPDLILLDVVMPGIDGYETCHRIKADPVGSEVPVIFLTGRDDPEGEAFGLGLGAVDYIAKPISPATVRARIRTHLALRETRLALERQNVSLEARVHQRTERLRQLSAELVLAEERERHRIAQELHDGPTQRLVFSKIGIGRLQAALGDTQRSELDELSRDLDTTLKELRTLMVQLSPPALYELGLGPAVEWLAETILGRHGIGHRVDSDAPYNGLDESTRVFLFHAVRELMINIVKHARADRASISLNGHDGELHIEVRDDGHGFDDPLQPGGQDEAGGFGLFALRDRIDLLGGRIEIECLDGTRVTLVVPLAAEEAS
ncbi:MAG: response regulator [Rhodocyclaceae bacterium]|nr:response regulator [Rhodocyclaceae bacterium]